jgi:hypothetical protein
LRTCEVRSYLLPAQPDEAERRAAMAKTVTVDAGDLRAVLSLLRVYMGAEESAGHFKDHPGRLVPDARYVACLQSSCKQPFAWRAPGIIIEVGFIEMQRTFNDVASLMR